MLSIEEIITKLKNYWSKQNCLIVESYDMEMGAGTFSKKTTLDLLRKFHNKEEWNIAYSQICRRPSDSRFGNHPNRVNKFHQFQVIMLPIPENAQELYLNSLKELNINSKTHDIKFIEDDWSSPTLGASGLGYEIRVNGMEIGQFTYFQKVCSQPAQCLEITYGIERTALFIQKKSSINELIWGKNTKWSEVFLNEEYEMSQLYFTDMPTAMLIEHFNQYLELSNNLIKKNLSVPAYELCIKMSHYFNILDAKKAISSQEREGYIQKIRNLSQKCGAIFIN